MRRYAQTVLLFLLGGVLLKLAVTGTYLRYVRGVHLPLLVLAALALIAIAGATLWRDLRAATQPDEEATAPMRLGGLFETVVLSAPTRGAALPAARDAEDPESADGAGDVSAAEHRERALAAGLAAAAHEGFDARSDGEPPRSEALAAPTAVLGTVRPRSDPADTDAPTALLGAISGADPSGRDHPAGWRSATDGRPVHARAWTRYTPAAAVGTRGGWALLAVALVALVLSPPALGSYTAARVGSSPVPASATPGPVPAGDPAAMSLVDYAGHALQGGTALAGRQVRLTGFVLAGPRGEPYLVRLAVGCCAAGALPVKIGLTGAVPGALTPGGWVEVVGTYVDQTSPDPVTGASVPYLSVLEVTEIDPPADPYES